MPAVVASQIDPAEHILQLSTGYMPSTAIYLAAKLGIADLLHEKALRVEDLAAKTGVQADALNRVLRALASVGVFHETAERTYGNTPASELLRATPGSVRDLALWMSDPFHFRIYAEAAYSLETGKPAIEKVTGFSIFDYFPTDKAESEVFNRAMTSFSAVTTPAVCEAYDFSQIKTLVDVAGGHGLLLAEILKRHPQMQGLLFDMGHVIAGARPVVDAAGVGDRCHLISGDFFKEVPGADAMIMKHIIHDWDDPEAIAILRNCHRAFEAAGHGKVLLVELVLPGPNQAHFGKWLDLEMMLLPGGRERTEEQYRTLLRQSGFHLTRVIPTRSPVSVIEAEWVPA